jgi:hypothetical protein
LNRQPFNPKSKPARRQDAAAHPVLAQLPDVVDEPAAQRDSSRADAAGFVDYRFDMPGGVDEVEPQRRLRVRAPAFRQPPRNEHRPRPLAASLQALPESNPFEFPVASMLDRLAPVASFLTLFLLFTAIGTFVLSTTREAHVTPKHAITPASPSSVPLQQKLEPAMNIDHPTIASPKAIGPLGSSPPSTDVEGAKVTDTRKPKSAVSPRGENQLSLSANNGEPLPKVQTTEPAATPEELADDSSAARFTGTIEAVEEAPAARSSKPPEVARLPAIFEAPRHAYQ